MFAKSYKHNDMCILYPALARWQWVRQMVGWLPEILIICSTPSIFNQILRTHQRSVWFVLFRLSATPRPLQLRFRQCLPLDKLSQPTLNTFKWIDSWRTNPERKGSSWYFKWLVSVFSLCHAVWRGRNCLSGRDDVACGWLAWVCVVVLLLDSYGVYWVYN